ncbi:MAG: PAS domain-containing sensor histidine kinase [Daejeonella sp.]|uniref:PAS domain S-box protein n=1 Tax=Daejeonella sp. TaxID=2805397 RepID=UPI003C730A3F
MSSTNQLINIISPMPTAVAVVDMDMKYLAASRQWIDDYGLQGQEILGKSHYDLFPEIGSEWKEIHAECLKGKIQKNSRDKFVRLNGDIQWLSWDIRPWKNDNGQISGMIMYTEDITSRVVEEIELKRNLDLLNETNEAAKIGSWEYDILTKKVYWSSMVKQIFDIPDHFVPDFDSITTFFRNDSDKNVFESAVSDALKNRNAFDIDLDSVTSKGRPLWIRVRGNPHCKDDQCIRISGTIQDIQELKIRSIQLKDSEEKYKSILENSLTAQFLIQPDGYILEANQAALDMFGYTIDEMRTLGRSGIMDTADPKFASYIKEREKNGFAKAELTGIRKNGERFPHEISSVSFRDSNGVQRTSVSMVDITERKKAEEKQKNVESALREERELLRTLIDNIPTSIFVKDLQSRKVLVNKAECEFMRVKEPSELLGKDNFELLPLDFANQAFAEDKVVFETGNAIIDSEMTVTWKDGTTRSILCSKIPLYDNGKISGLLGITHDITKIREAETALLESERKYRRIFENIQDVFYQTDQYGIVTEVSPSIERHFGYTRDEVLGRAVTDFYYSKVDREQLLETLNNNRIVTDFQVCLKTKAGEKRYSSVNAQLLTRNGEVIGIEGSMRDVTERKLQEDSLKLLNDDLNTLNEQKNKLLSVIAHDLRNPISGCVALLEIVFMDVENTSKEELVEYMEMMQKGVLNAHELLEDLLEWARIQFHSVDFIPYQIDDLAGEVRHTLKKTAPIAEAKQVELTQEIEEGMPMMADRHMLASIIRNLVTNAIKFSNKDGKVKVSASRTADGILFTVADNGIGIAPSDIGKLFSDETGFTSYGTLGEKGTGMGLGLCRNFVEKHSGKIWVESTQGVGSKFYFNIPDPQNIL